jgi:alpha-acetolactate decarboxylase
MKHAATYLSLLFLGACAAASHEGAWNGSIESWGTLRETLRDGHVEGRVAVADVARPGMYGVGALAGLRGEITILDGTVWVSEGTADGTVTTRATPSTAVATVLFAAQVGEWRDVAVDDDVDPSELDAFVAAQARAAGLDTAQPFPFLVEGGLRHLGMHVIAGECPIRARMVGKEESTAYERHFDRVDGRLVGIYAPDSSGVLCHMGSKTHVHALIEQDGGVTGHAESVGLARGSVLKLPR